MCSKRFRGSLEVRMIPRMFERTTDLEAATHDRRRYADVDVIDLVARVGGTALEQFLEGLKPHFAAVQNKDRRAAERLAEYLHDSAVAAAVVVQAGGLEALDEREAKAAAGGSVSLTAAVEAINKAAS